MNRTKINLKDLPLHVLILPFFFILKTINYYSGLITISASIFSLLKLLAVSAVLILLLYLVLRNRQKTAALATILGLFLLFFDNIKNLFSSLAVFQPLAHYRFYLPFILIISGFIAYRIVRARNVDRLNVFLNLLLGLYFLIEVWNFYSNEHNAGEDKTSAVMAKDELSKTGKEALPNIYYLLLDCYPSSSFQKEVLDIDNKSFDSSLKARNFYVAPNSSSNYNRTAFSMAATFNMTYLQWLRNNSETAITDYAKAISILKRPALYKLLKKSNYQFYNLSIFDIGDQPAIYKESFLTASTEEIIFYNTFWGFIKRQWYWRLDTKSAKKASVGEMKRLYEPKKEYNKKILDSLSRIAEESSHSSRFFLYAHLYLPHFPYFYDEQGKPYGPASIYNDSLITDRKKFTGYLAYTNKRVLEILDRLFEKTDQDIVIVQSDHGIEDIPPATHRDAFRNYFAVYFPDRDYRLLNDHMSNVNTFRVLLNKYLKTDLPLLKDQSFYLKN